MLRSPVSLILDTSAIVAILTRESFGPAPSRKIARC